MFLLNALNAIIDDGIEAARQSYHAPRDRLKLAGAIRGFEECRGQGVVEIAALVARAATDRQTALHAQAADYWFWRCREAEIGWVANVLSAILLNQGRSVIVMPTVRGMLKAAEVVGVREAPDPPDRRLKPG